MAEEVPEYTLRFVAGDTVRRRILIEDPDPESPDPENPIYSPRPLTGWTGRSQIRKSPASEEVLAEFTVSGFDETGIVELYLSPEQSQPLGPLSSAAFDLELTSPAGDVDTVLGGPVKPKQDVTRD